MKREETERVLEAAVLAAREYLASVDERLVRSPEADETAHGFGGSLPEEGVGALAAVKELLDAGPEASVTSAGPRFFHWVIGGVTPAALAADWFASSLDQNAAAWDASPLGTRLEELSLSWLKELFGLPQEWGGVLTTGATMANFTGLAVARRWWGERHGVDVDDEGFAGLPQVPVLSERLHPRERLQGARAPRHRAQVGADVHARRDRSARRRRARARAAWAERRAGDPRGERGGGELRRLRSDRAAGRSRRRSTTRGCTWTAHSGCSPPPRRGPSTSSGASSARTPSSRTGTNG